MWHISARLDTLKGIARAAERLCVWERERKGDWVGEILYEIRGGEKLLPNLCNITHTHTHFCNLHIKCLGSFLFQPRMPIHNKSQQFWSWTELTSNEYKFKEFKAIFNCTSLVISQPCQRGEGNPLPLPPVNMINKLLKWVEKAAIIVDSPNGEGGHLCLTFLLSNFPGQKPKRLKIRSIPNLKWWV